MTIRRLAGVAAAALVLGFATPADAGDTILAVSGKVTGGAMSLTLAEIEAIGSARIVTTTPWHDGRTSFESVPMARFLEAVGAHGTTAYVEALNNFAIEIPLSDLTRFNAILALKTDGNYMKAQIRGHCLSSFLTMT